MNMFKYEIKLSTNDQKIFTTWDAWDRHQNIANMFVDIRDELKPGDIISIKCLPKQHGQIYWANAIKFKVCLQKMAEPFYEENNIA